MIFPIKIIILNQTIAKRQADIKKIFVTSGESDDIQGRLENAIHSSFGGTPFLATKQAIFSGFTERGEG